MKRVLNFLGRGIQKDKQGHWQVTEDLEVCDGKGAHLPVRVPIDDSNSLCLVGGGELNLLAGTELYRRNPYDLVICAYGDRTDYLKSIDAPSESMVISALFRKKFPDANIREWTKEMVMTRASNTNSEMLNAFMLAVTEFPGVPIHMDIVTIDVHMPRALVFGQRHLATRPELSTITAQYHVSEQVLVDADPATYYPRREALRKSQAFERNYRREADGILNTLKNIYGDEKPPVTV